MALNESTPVGILGAGAMGSGIAQVAAAAGHEVVVVDAHEPALEKASTSISKSLARDVEKSRLTAEQAKSTERRIRFVAGAENDFSAFRECELVIEAIVEQLETKRAAFKAIEPVVSEACVLA